MKNEVFCKKNVHFPTSLPETPFWNSRGLAAWNHYLQAMAVYRPHLLIPLLRYLALITKLATQYTFPGWSTYDRLFRLQLVNDDTLSWDRMDD